MKSKMREKVRPKMGKIDIDYQKLHDAFFKWQTKPKLTIHGDLYYEVGTPSPMGASFHTHRCPPTRLMSPPAWRWAGEVSPGAGVTTPLGVVALGCQHAPPSPAPWQGLVTLLGPRWGSVPFWVPPTAATSTQVG